MFTKIREPHLTKSKFISGLQCHKKLWLECHSKTDYQEPIPGSGFHIGSKIGEAAHNLFPDGILIEEAAFEHEAALRSTQNAIDNAAIPAIFEAAFEYNNIRIRVDILQRHEDGSWSLIEIKSASTVKDHHVNDAALQYYVLTQCGLKIRSAQVGRINKEYTKTTNTIDWETYFVLEDQTEAVLARQNLVATALAEQRSMLAGNEAPEVAPNKNRCSKPYTCEQWEDCTASKPLDWVHRLYRMNWKVASALEISGVVSAADIPLDYDLSADQSREYYTHKTGKEFISKGLPDALSDFGPPAHYLDFEFSRPTLPYFQNTTPTELIAFQWSCHFISNKEELLKLTVSDCLSLGKGTKPNSHFEYLADGDVDPSRECAEKLLDILGKDQYPILVYHATAEKSAIKSLAKRVPERSAELLSLLPRLRDLLPVVRSHTCLPEFFKKPLSLSGGTYSIKTIANAFDPEFDYANLTGIAKGDAAAEAFYRLVSGEFAVDENRQDLRDTLLAYCQYDTIAMIVIHKGLWNKSGSP
ncbi:hypothetical protein A9Q83_09645 [Alphaproteobacteria bacterium 46_93_T64]|nr:hypothetical protein A9Q83_09645 [Alphaproteobacteria bacterium 46_93_T64]